MRWAVDTEEDLRFAREVGRTLGRRDFTWEEVVALVDAQPALLQINASVRQKSARD